MNNIKTPPDNALKQVQAALQRAAIQARKTAMQTDTNVVVIRDGKISKAQPI